MDYEIVLQKCVVVLVCVYFLWKIIRYIWSFRYVEKEPVVVLVTGAAGMFHLTSFSSWIMQEGCC